jgi:hypothetical protein
MTGVKYDTDRKMNKKKEMLDSLPYSSPLEHGTTNLTGIWKHLDLNSR